MRYEEARPQIADGDCILVRETTGFLTPFTRFFTRSDYTHAGMARWTDDGLYMVEINGGKNHEIPLSQHAEGNFDVFHRPASATGDIRQAMHDALRLQIKYGFLSLLLIGFIDFFRIKVFLHARRILSCAGFVVSIYEAAGLPETTRILSPADLGRLLTLKLVVRSE